MEVENEANRNMCAGDIFVVKKGVGHRVSAVEECSIMDRNQNHQTYRRYWDFGY